MTDIWKAALTDLSTKVSAHNFDSWFREIGFHHCDEDTAFLEVADDFYKAWIEDNYLDLIEDSLEAATERRLDVVIAVRGTLDENGVDEPVDAHVDARPPRKAARQSRTTPVEVDEREARPVNGELRDPGDFRRQVGEAGMNPRYTFEEFVVGSSNQFVHAACVAVASNPARTYNPLFIYGGVGLGKTHLLQSVGIEALKRSPETRVVYVSSEEFMNQLITSLRNKDMHTFRDQYRNSCELLLIDDIQFIAGKDSTQEEFFHTFNALYHSGKQIVVTSDQPPKELPGIEERLASRFSWGLIADIQPPEMETRIAILEKKAEADGIELDGEVAMLIASSVRSNVRELEGTLIRLGAQASLMNQPITIDFARDMLRRMNIEEGRQITTERIIKVVSNHFGIKPSDIRGSRRVHSISKPRQVAMYLARKHTEDSYLELGRAFSKDHSTVIAAFQKLEEMVDDDDGEPLVDHVHEIESILLR